MLQLAQRVPIELFQLFEDKVLNLEQTLKLFLKLHTIIFLAMCPLMIQILIVN